MIGGSMKAIEADQRDRFWIDRRLSDRYIALATTVGLFWILVLPGCLLARRFAGALQSPLSGLGLTTIALSTILLTLAVARSFHTVGLATGHPVRRFVLLLLAGGLGTMAAAMSLPGTSTTPLVFMWGSFVVVAIWLVARSLQPATDLRRQHEVRRPPVLTPASNRLDQQLTRGRDESGHVFVQGTVRVEIPAGHRSASLHVAICPPLERVPDVQVEQVDGPPATVHVGIALPQGIRFDVRTDESADQDQAVTMEFYALERHVDPRRPM